MFSRRFHLRHSALCAIIAIGFTLLLCAPEAFAGQATLSWNAPTTNADGTPLTDLAGYIVYYGTGSQNYTSSIDIGNQTTYVVTGLTAGQTYFFAVTAYDQAGNESTFSSEVSTTIPIATTPVVASFSANPTTGTAPLNVAFTDTSSGPVSSWLWNFGDGTTSSAQHPTHTYANPGDYPVSLTVFDTSTTTARISLAWDPSSDASVGGYRLHYGTTSGSYDQQVDVGNQTSYTLSGLTAGQTYFFAVTAYDLDGTSESDFSNEVSTTLPAVAATGTSDTASASIQVAAPLPVPPVASFSANPTTGTVPLNVAFSDTSSGPITSWLWNFGDGNSSTMQHPAHTYANPGAYSVSLTVSGPGGSDTTTLASSITVTDLPPVASFGVSPATGSAPLTVRFTDTSSGTITSWLWNFGDGVTTPVQHPPHTYANPGTYSVSLTVSGPGGSDTTTLNAAVSVAPPPVVASFSADPTAGAAPLHVAFTDTSSGPVSSWLWDFGDGTTSSTQHPTHTYANPGAYPVSLTVSGATAGASDTASASITVTVPPPAATVPPAAPGKLRLPSL